MSTSPEPTCSDPVAEDPGSGLSPGTHTVLVPFGSTVVEQRFHVAGRGPVCVVHSGGPGIGWEYIRMPVLEKDLTMVYIEPIGTGTSGRLADARQYNIATYTHFLHTVVERLSLTSFTLLGHSHGGFVAQRYALDHPERLASLILYDSSPRTGESFWAEATSSMAEFARRHVDKHPEVSSYGAQLTTSLGELDDKDATSILHSICPAYFYDYWGREDEFGPARRTLRMFAAPSQGEGPSFDVLHELSGLATATLVVVGVADFICGPRWAHLMHEEIPDSRLVVLDEAGHLGHLEKPEDFARAVVSFLARAHTVLEPGRP
ncbi:proline iminopeptidase [Streptomyces sp. 840.1]|uniref:alpha/beta fold hydrolase n=1 Tax=Streptomyces sp. 840.1 TaxID=2485152 RepID=UPI000F462F91|nr:alpha/beta hydrolase [Streptomyces sp. 840.1]ROQ60135.1 proline iminopeptidase [Streptomyces sp. 840.1]